MKKYALYPGVGKVTPTGRLGYIAGRQLAACFRIPYSECLDTSNSAIAKVINAGRDKGAPPIHLIHLIPNKTGYYKLPNSRQNKIIVVEGLHQAVEKNG